MILSLQSMDIFFGLTTINTIVTRSKYPIFRGTSIRDDYSLMKPQLLNKHFDETSSFKLESQSYKNFLKIWHYHPELELVIILESTGTRFVGDNIEKFEAGEIILIGKNLPHLWLNDKVFFEGNPELNARAHVIHFHEDFAGDFFKIPEMRGINELIKKAQHGVKFHKDLTTFVIEKVNKMFTVGGYQRFMLFIDVLKDLSESQDYQLLSSTSYVNSFREMHNSKMAQIHEYIMNNFKENISLEKVAGLANMNPSSFSRYFKHYQKKTFIQYLNEVRIGYACKLLIENDYTVAGVCFEAGFNNVSNFNRQFKALKKISPTEYIKLYSKHLN